MELNLPVILEADDYHEFKSQLETLNKAVFKDTPKQEPIAFKEIGFLDGSYQAVFYDKKMKPTNKDICELILKDNINSFSNIEEIKEYFDENDVKFSMSEIESAISNLADDGLGFKPEKSQKKKSAKLKR